MSIRGAECQSYSSGWQRPHDVINFSQANPSHADKYLTQFGAIMADIKYLSNRSAGQSAMLDFFKM